MNADPAASRRREDRPVPPATYGRNFSYFSHRVFVAFLPGELHEYLHRLLSLTPEGDGPDARRERDTVSVDDRYEIEFVRWVLLHRSQLNALALNRLIESWRGSNDELLVPGAASVRLDPSFSIDITLQFAIELELAVAQRGWWVQTRPRLMLALLDAAYYVSRQWQEHDRSGPPAAATPVNTSGTLDFTEAGKPAFRAYMVHRMNLYEDGNPTPQLGEDAARVARLQSTAALSESELNWLFGVAAAIARNLSPAAKRADLKLRWSTWAAPTHGNPATAPSDALFEALLVGDESVLVEDAPSGSPEPSTGNQHLRFRWRYGAAGDAEGIVDIQTIEQATAADRQLIDRVEALTEKAMFPASSTPDPDRHSLRLLADRYRILPISPAWPRVEQARNNVTFALGGLGNPATLQQDRIVLNLYGNLLRTPGTANAVAYALIIGAALAAKAPDRPVDPATGDPNPVPDDAGWAAALEALCKGLGLEQLESEAAAETLHDLGRRTSGYLGFDWPPVLRRGDGGWPDQADLARAVEAAYVVGSAEPAPESSELVQQAWQALQGRLTALAKNAFSRPLPEAVELVCAVRELPPATMLPLRPERAGPRVWTTVLMEAVSRRPPAPDAPPVTIAAHALERLGARTLRSDLHARWTRDLASGNLSPEDAEALRHYVETTRIWRGGRRHAAIALVLGQAATTLTESWTTPPTVAITLAAQLSQVDRMLSLFLQRWIQMLDVPLLVAWEPEVVKGHADYDIARDALLKATGDRLMEIWLARSTSTGVPAPYLVDPAGPDALWSHSGTTR
jgi:hypothetical protein